MNRAEFGPLIEKAIGKNAADWEIDRTFTALEPYPAWAVVAVLVPLNEPPRLPDLLRMVANQVAVREARERALTRSTCEHGHEDRPFDRCPSCQPVYAASAHKGADLCRASMAEAKR